VKVKVLEVDTHRKRILLSIKQTQEMPSFQKNTTKQKPVEKNMNDALADLKSKFGK
jgi:ribosomal protein S1